MQTLQRTLLHVVSVAPKYLSRRVCVNPEAETKVGRKRCDQEQPSKVGKHTTGKRKGAGIDVLPPIRHSTPEPSTLVHCNLIWGGLL